jgi:hypothetical protein
MWGYLLSLAIGYTVSVIRNKSDKISQIHKVIAEYSPNVFVSWYKTAKVIAKIQYDYVYDECIRKVKTPRYVSHELFEVEYFHKGKKYRILIQDTVKDHVSLNVYDGKGNDITGKFLEYFGPQYDFHNKVYTPRDLGYEKIVIIDGDLNEIVYDTDECIRIGPIGPIGPIGTHRVSLIN